MAAARLEWSELTLTVAASIDEDVPSAIDASIIVISMRGRCDQMAVASTADDQETVDDLATDALPPSADVEAEHVELELRNMAAEYAGGLLGTSSLLCLV